MCKNNSLEVYRLAQKYNKQDTSFFHITRKQIKELHKNKLHHLTQREESLCVVHFHSANNADVFVSNIIPQLYYQYYWNDEKFDNVNQLFTKII